MLLEDHVGPRSGRLDPPGVPLVGTVGPGDRLLDGLAEAEVPGQQSPPPEGRLDPEVQRQIQELGDLAPAVVLEQQVVALDQDDGPLSQGESEGVGHRLLDRAVEGGDPDGVAGLRDPESAHRVDEAVDVEGVRGPHPLAPAEFAQALLGQVVSVEREDERTGQLRAQPLGDRRLAGAGGAGESHEEERGVGRRQADRRDRVADRVQDGRRVGPGVLEPGLVGERHAPIVLRGVGAAAVQPEISGHSARSRAGEEPCARRWLITTRPG